MKRNTTAGPPSKAALPTVEKIPAPMIAATPNAVRSHTPRVRLNPEAPPWIGSPAARICSMVFVRKSAELQLTDDAPALPGIDCSLMCSGLPLLDNYAVRESNL